MKTLSSIAIIVAISAIAIATPYIPPELITTHYGRMMFEVPAVDATFNHMFEFCQIAQFDQPLQCEDPGTNWGGEREEEPGGMWTVIETDNTLEAIWLWSRYRELTGNTQYDDEVRDAWIYAWQWPAWLEGAGYYSSHNCAWGLAAELKYRTVFNDSSQWNYAVNCANYILQTELPFTSSLNVMVTGWCCGNLYLYGEAVNNLTYKNVAYTRARQITTWVEQNPTVNLGLESWAMSSGTFIWGVCNSYFRQDPATGQNWLATYGPMVQVFEPSTAGWSNAWNVAYCNAQGAMFDVTGNQTYANHHLALTNMLLRCDGDNDGGIPASAIGAQNADASWTTAYLAMMGCNRYLGSAIDAGVLIINSPRTMTGYNLGTTLPITLTVGNWGTTALTNVMVTMAGAYQDTMFVNLTPGQNQTINMGNWTPLVAGIDSMWATVSVAGDTDLFNNSDISRFKIRNPVEWEGMSSLESIHSEKTRLVCNPNPFNNSTTVRFTLTVAGEIDLAIFNVKGELVQRLYQGYASAGEQNMTWEGNNAPSGIYFIRLISDGHQPLVHKVLLIK
jgi:hypothetical protein